MNKGVEIIGYQKITCNGCGKEKLIRNITDTDDVIRYIDEQGAFMDAHKDCHK